MSGKVGRAVQPSPSANFVKTWQGCLEVILRLAVLLSACGALVASALALTKLDDISDAIRLLIITVTGRNPDPLIKNSTAAAGVGIAVGGVVILMEILGILQRFCNIRGVSRTITFFLSLDVILSFLWAVGFSAAGILAADSARQWSDINNRLENPVINIDIIEDTLTLLAVTAGTTLLAGLLTSLLMVLIICSLLKSH